MLPHVQSMPDFRSNAGIGSEGVRWDGAVDFTPRPCSPSPANDAKRKGFCIPGYAGHERRKEPEHLFGIRFHLANEIAVGAADRDAGLRWTAVSADSRSQSPVTVPGYAGHVPGKGPASNCGLRFPVANHVAAGGARSSDPLDRSHADERRSFSPIPGYAGHLHGSRSEAVFGLTFQAASEVVSGVRHVKPRQVWPTPVPGYSGCAPVRRFDPADVANSRAVAGARLSMAEERRSHFGTALRLPSEEPPASECSALSWACQQDLSRSTRVGHVATPTRTGVRSSPSLTGSDSFQFSEDRTVSERSKGASHSSGTRGRSASPRDRSAASAPRSPHSRNGLAIPGYTGYVPMKKAEAVFGARFRAANDLAVTAATASMDHAEHCGIYSKKTRPQSAERRAGHIPGYGGHLPRKRNVFGEGFRAANECAVVGQEVDKKAAWSSPRTPAACAAIAGYAGHIPSKNAEHIHGKTFQAANALGVAEYETLRSRGAGQHRSSEPHPLHIAEKTAAHDMPAAGQAQGVLAAQRTHQVSIEWTRGKD